MQQAVCLYRRNESTFSRNWNDIIRRLHGRTTNSLDFSRGIACFWLLNPNSCAKQNRRLKNEQLLPRKLNKVNVSACFQKSLKPGSICMLHLSVGLFSVFPRGSLVQLIIRLFLCCLLLGYFHALLQINRLMIERYLNLLSFKGT